MTKPVILVKTCHTLLYVIQGVIDKSNFLASADIKAFGHIYLLFLIGFPLFLNPGYFCLG